MMQEEEKEAICKLLATEALSLLRTSLEFQDKIPFPHEILKFSGLRLWSSSAKQRFNHLLKSSLVSGLLLDLIVNKPEIIVFIITNLYENYLNSLKKNEIHEKSRFHSYLDESIKLLLLENPKLLSYLLVNTSVGKFIFKVCKSILRKNTNDLIETVEKHGTMIGKFLKDFNSFKAYMKFLDVYSCVLEAPVEIFILSNGGNRVVFSNFKYFQKILEFYRKYYKKLYLELELRQKPLAKREGITEYEKELEFASVFTIYYLMIKTIECVAKAFSKIKQLTPIYDNDKEEEKQIKLKLNKLIVDYLFHTYTHFCENILIKAWFRDNISFYDYSRFTSVSSIRTMIGSLLGQTYKLTHRDLEFYLLRHTISRKGIEHTYCNKCKSKIFRIARCKSMVEDWVNNLCGKNSGIVWRNEFES